MKENKLFFEFEILDGKKKIVLSGLNSSSNVFTSNLSWVLYGYFEDVIRNVIFASSVLVLTCIRKM